MGIHISTMERLRIQTLRQLQNSSDTKIPNSSRSDTNFYTGHTSTQNVRHPVSSQASAANHSTTKYQSPLYFDPPPSYEHPPSYKEAKIMKKCETDASYDSV